jgi:hypothetical protein
MPKRKKPKRKVSFGGLSIGDRFYLEEENTSAHTKIKPRFGSYVRGWGNLVLVARDDFGVMCDLDVTSMVYVDEE